MNRENNQTIFRGREQVYFLLFVMTLFLAISCNSFKKDKQEGLKSNGKDTSKVTGIETRPEFPGGYDSLATYLLKNIKYPEQARKERTTGIVKIQFTVTAEGKITGAKVVESLSRECDEEALRVISTMPAWKPALKDGNPVDAIMVLPVKFALAEKIADKK